MLTTSLATGMCVVVRRGRRGRVRHLWVRIVADGWFIGHDDRWLCHRARLADVLRIAAW